MNKGLNMRGISFPLITMLLIMCVGILSAGTTGKIAGKVTDAATGQPLAGANVLLEGTILGASTDAEGDYFIIGVEPGVYTIKATWIGYEIMNQTGIGVQADRSITVNFALNQTTLEGEEVTVEGQRQIVKLDVSSSQSVADGEAILSVPMVTDVTDFLNLQAGVEGMNIRGGGLDQTGFMMDGLDMNDNRANRPVIAINLSSVREVSVIRGGFNAEYGNIRSGLINVVTKEGSPTRYHGSVDLRMAPAYQKHSGSSITSGDIYWYRPYVDPDVAFVGTTRGAWSKDKRDQNLSFIGWNKISERRLDDDDPSNDMTPQECYDYFLWEHALEGSGDLGQRELSYADNPDWQGEVSLDGPVPIIGKMLGNMSFFISHRNVYEMFPLPRLYGRAFREQNSQIKLTSRLARSMKLNLLVMINEINSAVRLSGEEDEEEMPVEDDYFRSADEMLEDGLMRGGQIEFTAGGYRHPFKVKRNMIGLTFDHVLSPQTFYSVRVSRIDITNRLSTWAIPERDTVAGSPTGHRFGSVWIDERPWGKARGAGNSSTLGDGVMYSTFGYGLEDSSEVTTYNAKFDIISQVDKHNQIKAGLMFNIDFLRTNMWNNFGTIYMDERFAGNKQVSDNQPIRGSAYIQDKLEFEGMIANIGLRLDYSNPNTDWYYFVDDSGNVDRYSEWFRDEYRNVFLEQAPKKSPQKSKLILSPRFGISHPIGTDSKIFFNYGHFFSMPISADLYRVSAPEAMAGISYIADPYIDPPRTIAYELGFEYNLFNTFLFSTTWYYKDVTSQTGDVSYTNFDESVEYTTRQSNHYADIRGVEFTLEKRFGRWITGWINYNYMVQTSGYFGRSEYYQDPREQRIQGIVDPKLEQDLAQPVARANINLLSPVEFGPSIAGVKPFADWQLGWLVTYSAGEYITWDPLNTYELQNNLQRNSEWNVDLRLSKKLRFGRTNITIFADIVNVFDIKYLNLESFADVNDYNDYMKSLNLDMYKDEQYTSRGYVGGSEVVGDVYKYKPEDKKYDPDSDDFIDMPNLDHLWYLNPKHIWLGLQFNF
jgi:hypothetical protein